MTGWLLASYVTLWVLVVLVAIVALVVLRQLGLIYVSMDSSGHIHLGEGPERGSVMDGFDARDELTGNSFHVPDARSGLTLVAFVSSHCAICLDVARAACEVEREYQVAVVVLATDAEGMSSNDELRAAVRPPVRFAVSTARHGLLGVRSTPQAVVLGGDGLVLEKGIVNGVAHLRELLD
ncbi:MAG: hypothetical protein ACRDVP_00905, partial [Acidimicrobiales bacterium]